MRGPTGVRDSTVDLMDSVQVELVSVGVNLVLEGLDLALLTDQDDGVGFLTTINTDACNLNGYLL